MPGVRSGRAAFDTKLSGEALGQPALDILTPPPDGPAVKSLFLRKVPDSAQRGEYPPVAARESRDVVGTQEFLMGRKAFIDPLRQ